MLNSKKSPAFLRIQVSLMYFRLDYTARFLDTQPGGRNALLMCSRFLGLIRRVHPRSTKIAPIFGQSKSLTFVIQEAYHSYSLSVVTITAVGYVSRIFSFYKYRLMFTQLLLIPPWRPLALSHQLPQLHSHLPLSLLPRLPLLPHMTTLQPVHPYQLM